MCTISKIIGLHKEKEICLPNKKFLSDHKHVWANMANKCKIFVAIT